MMTFARTAIASVLGALVALAFIAPAGAQQQSRNIFEAVIGIETKISGDARSARFLGTARQGSGAVIDADGLVVTIGYLILEASEVTLLTRDGRRIPANVLAYDHDSGLGLVRATAPIKVAPLRLGSSAGLDSPLIKWLFPALTPR